MVNEGRIASFDGGVLTFNPELRVAGFTSIPSTEYSIAVPIEAAARDSQQRADTGAMWDGATVTMGHDNVGVTYHGGFSFRIPIDFNLYTIRNAILSVFLTTLNNNPVLRVHAELAANSAAFGAGAFDITNRQRTHSYASFQPLATSWQEVDITTVLQDFVGQMGSSWQLDNYLTFIFMSVGNPLNNFTLARTWNFGSLMAGLTITYSD